MKRVYYFIYALVFVLAISSLAGAFDSDGYFVNKFGDTMRGELISTDGSALASKDYVDEQSAGGTLLYFATGSDSADLGATYKTLKAAVPDEASVTTGTLSGTNVLAGQQITDIGLPDILEIRQGQFEVHLTANYTGAKVVTVQPTLWTRTVDGTETQLATVSSPITLTSTKAHYSGHINIPTAVPIASSTRILMRLYATVDAPGSTVTMHFGGENPTYIEVPQVGNVFARTGGSNIEAADFRGNLSLDNHEQIAVDSSGNASFTGQIQAADLGRLGGLAVTSDKYYNGNALHINYISEEGYFQAYNFSGSVWKPLHLKGSYVDLWGSNNKGLTINADGNASFTGDVQVDGTLYASGTAKGHIFRGNPGAVTTSIGNGGGIDIYNMSVLIGAEYGKNTRTDSTTKYCHVLAPSYLNSGRPFPLIFGSSSAARNDVNLGGGSGVNAAATRIGFFTSDNQSNLIGTEAMHIDGNQNVMIGAASVDANTRLLVTGNASFTGSVEVDGDQLNNGQLHIGAAGNRVLDVTDGRCYVEFSSTTADEEAAMKIENDENGIFFGVNNEAGDFFGTGGLPNSASIVSTGNGEALQLGSENKIVLTIDNNQSVLVGATTATGTANLQVQGGIHCQGNASFTGSVETGGDKVTFKMSDQALKDVRVSHSFAAGEVKTLDEILGTTSTEGGYLTIWDNSGFYVGRFIVNGSANSVTELEDASTKFSQSASSSNTINVLSNGGSTYSIENGYASARSMGFIWFGRQ